MLTNKKERSRSHALKNAGFLSRQASSNATKITHVKIKPAFLPGVKYMRICRKNIQLAWLSGIIPQIIRTFNNKYLLSVYKTKNKTCRLYNRQVLLKRL